jgi:bifunctional DNA-binding transcriptional regulator/antitoxin component of YhaV-PrlF toxin-antitoxin module
MGTVAAKPDDPWLRPVTALEHPHRRCGCRAALAGHDSCVNRVSRVSGSVSPRPSRVQERLIAALIPDALEPCDDVASAPLPVLPTLTRLEGAAPGGLVVSTTRIDRSGRVHERFLLRELGWEPGQQWEMDTMHGMILIAATRSGQHTVDVRGAISLPAALRHLCGIEPGPPLVLAAVVPEQVMVIHPADTVARLLAAHYTDLIGINRRGHTDTPPGENTSSDSSRNDRTPP